MNNNYPQINFDAADISKRCAACNQIFYEKQNIGQWECSQHFGSIENGAFTCCNLRTNCYSFEEFYAKNLSDRLRGCVRCDHRITTEPYNDFSGGMQVPRKYLVALNIKKDAVEVKDNMMKQNVFTVLRYDKIRKEKLKRRMYLHFLAVKKMADAKYKLKQPLI